MTLKEKWKKKVREYDEYLTIKQLAIIMSQKKKEYRKFYLRIYRDLERGKLDYTQFGGERRPIIIDVEEACNYIDKFNCSYFDEIPESKLLPFPNFQ